MHATSPSLVAAAGLLAAVLLPAAPGLGCGDKDNDDTGSGGGDTGHFTADGGAATDGGAAGDGGTATTTLDLTGSWTFTWTLRSADPPCDRKAGAPIDEIIAVSHDVASGVVDLTGFLGDPKISQSGILSGSVLTYSGKVPEDGGTTNTHSELTVAEDGNSMTGEEVWSWSRGPTACDDSVSDVEAVRLE